MQLPATYETIQWKQVADQTCVSSHIIQVVRKAQMSLHFSVYVLLAISSEHSANLRYYYIAYFVVKKDTRISVMWYDHLNVIYHWYNIRYWANLINILTGSCFYHLVQTGCAVPSTRPFNATTQQQPRSTPPHQTATLIPRHLAP